MTDSTVVTPFLADAATAELEDWGPLEEATGEPMQTAGLTLWQDGEQEIGVWECTPGPSYWKLETHEFVHIVSGRMTVTPDGGDSLHVGPGQTAVFRRAGQAPGRSTRRSASSTCSSSRRISLLVQPAASRALLAGGSPCSSNRRLPRARLTG
jgi:uncharacterized cupin superfamily protein